MTLSASGASGLVSFDRGSTSTVSVTRSVTACARLGVPEDDRAALLGHEDERITSRVYGHDGPGLQRLRAIVEKISYSL